MTLLTVHDLSKRFEIHHLQREIAVFDDISFTLSAGEFLMVGGVNGAGKSTLLRCLYRTYVPSAGQAHYYAERGEIDLVRAADVDIAWLRRTEIGFVTQFLRPRPRISALDLVAEPLLAAGVEATAATERASHMLSMFGLKQSLWQAYPSTFSGGEQQKVNLARALIRPCRLLLLDEPTASLDKATREALTARLAELKQAGVAMIGIFHHPEDLAMLIDAKLEVQVATSSSMDDLSHLEAQLRS